MKLFFGSGKNVPIRNATDLRERLQEDKKHHYQDGYSMAEAAKCWVLANGYLPPVIAGIVGSKELNSAHFEFPTPVWGGGIAMTDIMAFVPRPEADFPAEEAEIWQLTFRGTSLHSL
jgi:hypothetical protein